MKLRISKPMMLKIQYFLKRFPSKEWSGPAFYKFVSNKKTMYFELVYFKSIDLGAKADTEFSGDDLNKAIPGIWKTYPETKNCIQGLIHSHNTMGAYHSGTDTNQMKEAVKDIRYKHKEDNFYPSLVVSSQVGKEYAFAVAYRDQYNVMHLMEKLPVVLPVEKVKEVPEWVAEADTIFEESKKKPVISQKYMKVNANQGSLLGNNFTYHAGTNTYYATSSLSIFNSKKRLKDLTISDIKTLAKDGVVVEKYLRRILSTGDCTTETELEIFEKIVDGVIDEESMPEDIANSLWQEACSYADVVNETNEPDEYGGFIC